MMIVYVQTSDYEVTSNDPEALWSEILGLTSVLQVLKCQLGEPVPYVPPKKHRTVDDILVHVANLLNTGLRSELVVAVSGSPSSIMDLTLTAVMQSGSVQPERNMVCLYLPHRIFTVFIMNGMFVHEKGDVQCTTTLCALPSVNLNIRYFFSLFSKRQ